MALNEALRNMQLRMTSLPAHVCHDNGIERGVEEHAVADDELAGHLAANQADGLVGRVAYRHDASRFAAFGTSEAFVGRVGLGIFMYESEVEEDAVDDDLRIPVGESLYHEQSLSDSAPLGYVRLYACDVLDRVAFAEVVVPSASRLTYLPLISIHPRSSVPR